MTAERTTLLTITEDIYHARGTWVEDRWVANRNVSATREGGRGKMICTVCSVRQGYSVSVIIW